MSTFLRDLRYGLRMMSKSPGFTAVAVLALALGVGANSAIFSVVNAVLLRPLPFAEPDRLVTPWGDRESAGKSQVVSYPDFADWREQTQALAAVAAYSPSGSLLRDTEEPLPLSGAVVSSDLFPVLDLKPLMGRPFTRDDDQPNSPSVTAISHALWQRRFKSDPEIIGKQLTFGSRGSTVVAVLPPGFKFPVQASKTDFLQPLAPNIGERVTRRGSYFLRVVARLKPGVTREQAEAEMKATGQRLESQYPDEGLRLGLRLIPLHDSVVGEVRPALLVLLGAVGLVLLIACANVANLLLARAASRAKEMAIRNALGASRLRVVRQLLTESLLLSAAGGTLGALLAMWGVDLLVAASPLDIPRLREVGLDARVVGFTAAVSVLTGVVFGLAPAWQSSRVDLHESLKEGARGSTGGAARNRVRSLLVVTEVALSLLLLVGAGLLVKSFLRLREVDPGFGPQDVFAVDLSLSRAKYPSAERQEAFFQEALGRTAALPGVASVGLVHPLPLGGSSTASTFLIEGRPAPTGADKPESNYRVISPDYFRAMSIPVVRGRAFNGRDTKDAPQVIVVNETFARRFFAGGEALGKRVVIETDVSVDPRPPAREIVGVVGDVRHETLEAEAGPEFYVAYAQDPGRFMTMVVRAAPGGPGAAGLPAGVRGALKGLDAEQYVPAIMPMTQLLADSFARRRFQMMLLVLFAAVALVLASVGIYGVMSYTVAQRVHEIGIRIALGARTRDVLNLVVGQGMTLALAGVGVGLAAAAALTRVMSSLLFGVSATDPLTFAGIPLLLLAVALLASYIPARRAVKVDPMVALRHE